MSIWESEPKSIKGDDRPVVVAPLSNYAYGYLKSWAERNHTDEAAALDEILAASGATARGYDWAQDIP